ncbi:hypothetical protein B0A79_12160 [Flavobacterium piscis]|uniref:Uncharacterized protein n=1 Tax=Flavobacterium piscis TaxID=1114874 RepID=A0ABX2XPU3_9FLAO|nr:MULTISPECIES: hypothetical protein [Flavobacterium]OCB78297.1 hypothetical protein FLP_00930 [Flavobacterium piscis]OXG04219.1 hypothetical protein B0A79_12160 [Flavobacterium piscis]QDW21123.1 hypothetical protein B0M43_0013710 [Flavobacterium sp. KBS0721]
MRLVNILQLLGLSKQAGYSSKSESEFDLHHHDLDDGSELLDETLHMKEQPFEDREEDDYASIF